MSISPIITFKAGACEVDQTSKPYKVKAKSQPGYIYLYSEDELLHFCWRPREVPLDQPELDLVMVPGDGRFLPYDTRTTNQSSSKTNGRIFSLKFSSSSERHLFWLQSKPQGRNNDPAWLSPRDRKIGEIVDRLLQGDDEVDINRELASVRGGNNDDEPGDEDATMQDADDQPSGHGGAGADATGGDVREEGEESREGGADGARAVSSGAPDASAAVRDFLASLQGGANAGRTQPQGKVFPLLNDLLDRSATIPVADSASEEELDNMLSYLPPAVLVLAQKGPHEADRSELEAGAESAAAARATLSVDQKRTLLKKVLRSPQFHQSLQSLTNALREGGLPSLSEALNIKVENGGFVKGGNVPLGGGEAVEAFVEGVKKTVQEKK